MNGRFLLLRLSSQHTAIDKTVYFYHGLINFKQYNTSKTAKYRLLYRRICDSQVKHTYFPLPYAGKSKEGPNQYYVTRINNYTKYLVEKATRVSRIISMKDRNITLDHFFTWISIADWFLEKETTITGAIRKVCVGIPYERKLGAGQEANSTIWAYNGKKMLISYSGKKKTKTKIGLFLISMKDELQLSSDQRSTVACQFKLFCSWRSAIKCKDHV